MKRLPLYITSNCISFTILVLFLSLLGHFAGSAALPHRAYLQLFAVTTLISVLMLCTDGFIPEEKRLLRTLAQLADTFLPVLLLGGLVFRWFPFSLPILALVAGIILLVYFSVIGVLALQARIAAKNINRAIREKRAGTQPEQEEPDGKNH